MKKKLTILGGGPAGLATGYYAAKRKLPFTIYEAGARAGGNAVTYKRGDFAYDSGPHRLHDQIPEVTAELKNLLGNDLKKIQVPSQIYYKGRFIDFPLSPLNLLKSIGVKNFAQAASEFIASKMSNKSGIEKNFKVFALNTYGKTIAENFLLNYSEKLWGEKPEHLAPDIAGKRMKGLNFRTFLIETFLGNKAKTKHLDGSFYYPEGGFGKIAEKLAEKCGSSIILNTPVKNIFHNNEQIEAIGTEDNQKVLVDEVINTLPVTIFLKLLQPAPPAEIVEAAQKIKFRYLMLIGFIIDKHQFSENASIYFPEKAFIFTRLYEPKNRSRAMAPPDKTMIIAEVPFFDEDVINEKQLLQKVRNQLLQTGLIEAAEITDEFTHTLKFAYPVLTKDHNKHTGLIYNYLKQFKNLHLTGRSSRFKYTHIHNLMQEGKEIVQKF